MEAAIKRQKAIARFIERFIENLLKAGKEKLTRSHLCTRLQLLESYWTQFQAGHFALMECERVEETEYATQDVYYTTEEAYVEAKTHVSALAAQSPDETSARRKEVETPRVTPLPSITLPSFSGDQLCWEGFRDLFRSLVHDVAALAPIQKLQYLRSSLAGEAAQAIANIEMSSRGYELAWDELVRRYDNRRVLLATHMRALLTTPPMTKVSAASIHRLLSAVNQAVRSFRTLNRPVEHWDDWFVHLLADKLDGSTRMLWESSLPSGDEHPTYAQLQEFLLTRARALEALGSPAVPSSVAVTRTDRRLTRRDGVALNAATTTDTGRSSMCPLCRVSHTWRSCEKFKALSAVQRRDQVRRTRSCFNCLSPGHLARSCPSTNRCRLCEGKHHTLLHGTQDAAVRRDVSGASSPTTPTAQSADATASRVNALTSSTPGVVLLATAMITLVGKEGRSLRVRALLDSGSEASFITERAVQRLRLPRRKACVTVTGLSGVSAGKALHAVSTTITGGSSLNGTIPLRRALVLPSLAKRTPGQRVPRGVWDHLRGLRLADPDFGRPASVEVILGADVYGSLLRGGVRRGRSGEPTAHETVFGWVLMGAASEPAPNTQGGVAVHHISTLPDIALNLQRFWELETVNEEKPLSPEESQCETLFAATHSRDLGGRYIVRLPRCEDASGRLGDSHRGALGAMQSLERRLDRNPITQAKYRSFMAEYEALGHMSPLSTPGGSDNEVAYLPHHAVVHPTDPDGKFRVVFNASFRPETGASLNETLLPGPRLQADLWAVLSRWRLFRFAFVADIVKMFRQIKVHPQDRDLQRILWRADPAQEMQKFQLNTLTYGTACAPYLALRTLTQLVSDEGQRFPLGATTVTSHMYVDDVLSGATSLQGSLEVKEQTINLLKAGGFELSKWAGNHSALSPDDQPERALPPQDAVGALGLVWSPASDTLRLRVCENCVLDKEPTKRVALSITARLFDPAGWAAPVLVGAKIFLQDLWKAGVEWDDPLPPPLAMRWRQFTTALPELEKLRLPRWTGVDALDSLELHGFADASEKAYAAAVYLRGSGPSGTMSTTLIVAKTRVAPLRPTSIPRLELCGALLLARLLDQVAGNLAIQSTRVYAWTDAKVVLAWLHDHPSRWKTFVANRVAAVLDKVPAESWHYVPTGDNPADAATRGIKPAELLSYSLWWTGPTWLKQSADAWPNEASSLPTTSEEIRLVAATGVCTRNDNPLLIRFSSLSRLIRVTAYCLRFLRGRTRVAFLTAEETNLSLLRWLRIVQRMDFADEMKALDRGVPITRNSSLRALRPFLDQEGLLRVGGRLHNSSLAYEERHPIIIPKRSHLALLLVRDAHRRTLHGGCQLTRSVLARRYWIIHASSLIRSAIHQCVQCVRNRGRPLTQQMGQLPEDRVRAARPFTSTGVDYAGPVSLRSSGGRGQKAYKGYVCLFVCMATKAVHLEAVSGLSSACFIAAFRRFVSRRGACTRLYSDNGTNFRGANRELRELFVAASNSFKDCRARLAADGTDWCFIPPSAPHFGGLWEAGVKAMKHHMRRVIGDSTLTYEELSTLLCLIEACLNSRPLYDISTDAGDLVALTPGHFLIGEAPISVPEPSTLSDPPASFTGRWRLVSHMRDSFWKSWSRDYLHRLQQLGKWRHAEPCIQQGDVVVIKDDLLPPTKWALARVRTVHPGTDGLVRVVTLDTATSSYKRPISKVCVLPVEHGAPRTPDQRNTVA